MPKFIESPHRATRTAWIEGKRVEMPAVKIYVNEDIARAGGLTSGGKLKKRRLSAAPRRSKPTA